MEQINFYENTNRDKKLCYFGLFASCMGSISGLVVIIITTIGVEGLAVSYKEGAVMLGVCMPMLVFFVVSLLLLDKSYFIKINGSDISLKIKKQLYESQLSDLVKYENIMSFGNYAKLRLIFKDEKTFKITSRRAKELIKILDKF